MDSSKKMGSNKSKGSKTPQYDSIPLSETAIQDPTISSTESNRYGCTSNSLISVDAVPVQGVDSGFQPPKQTATNLEIAEYVGKIIKKKFEPFAEDISENEEERKKKIDGYERYMDFEMLFGYHDAMILYHDDDKEDVERFLASIEKSVILKDNQKPKIALYPHLAISCGNNFRALEFGVERCTFVMLYVTSNFVKDAWSEYSSETCLMEAILNPKKKWSVVPVFADAKSSTSYRIPLSINTLKGVRYVPEESFYLESIKLLFNDRISVRKELERQHFKNQIKWVHELEAKAREEALERVKWEKEKEIKHKNFLQESEQYRDIGGIQPSSTSFQKENMMNSFVENKRPMELSVSKENELLKESSEKDNVAKCLQNLSNRADEGGDSGTSVDPQDKDIVVDTPSPATVHSAPFSMAPAASSSRNQSSNVLKIGTKPPPISNVTLTGHPPHSSSNQNSCSATSATALDNPAAAKYPQNTTSTLGSQSSVNHSVSSESPSGHMKKTHFQSHSEKEKFKTGVSASCIDHPLSQKSDSWTEIHHHHYYSEPPVYNIKAENIQIGSDNKLYNKGKNDESFCDTVDEYEPSCEKTGKDEEQFFNNDKEEDESETFSTGNSFVSTPSQDGAQSARPLNPNDREKRVLSEYGINPHNPRPITDESDQDQTVVKESHIDELDQDQTGVKEIQIDESDQDQTGVKEIQKDNENSNTEDAKQTYVKET